MGNIQAVMSVEGALGALETRPKRVLSQASHGNVAFVDEWLNKVGPNVLLKKLSGDGDTVFHMAVGFKAPALANLVACTEKALADPAIRMEAARVLKVQSDSLDSLTDADQVALLLGKLLSIPNSNGETPLHNAVSMSRIDAVAVLASKGSDPWAPDKGGGRTPLHFAAMRSAAGIRAIMQNVPAHMLQRPGMSHGRLIDVRTSGGFTPMHYAVSYYQPECVIALLNYNPNLHISHSVSGWFLPGQSPPGSTCLHIAGWKGYTDVCKMILMHWYEAPGGGVDPRLDRDLVGRTPHMLARLRGNTNVMRLLDPSYPLQALNPRLDSMPADEFSLAAIAGGALRAKLAASLVSAERLLKNAAATAAAAGPAQRAQNPCSTTHYKPALSACLDTVSASLHGPQPCVSPIHSSLLPSPFSCLPSSISQGLGSTDSTCVRSTTERCGSIGSGTVEGRGGGVRSRAAPRSPSSAAGATRSPEGSYHRGLHHNSSSGAAQANGSLYRRSSACASASLARKASGESSMSHGSAHKDPTRCDTACGVCWDASAVLLIAGCQHGLCLACAGHLVEGIRKRPLVCPFCRGHVSDLLPRPELIAASRAPSGTATLATAPETPSVAHASTSAAAC